MIGNVFLILSQVAIALTALAGLCITPWRENYGSAEGDAAGSGAGGGAGGGEGGGEGGGADLLSAMTAVRSSPPLLVLGSVYSLFEGSMYIFVFNWVHAAHSST